MLFADVITLIPENSTPHGIFENVKNMPRTVYCNVESIGFNEAYAAREAGLNPEFRVTLADAVEYGGERICELRGHKYKIVRTYVNRQRIELTVERVDQWAN